MHILLIEDEETLRQLMSDILLDVGHTVASADDGEQALALLDAALPDMIIADVKLPYLDGCEFTRTFRARYGDTIPIIIMSAAYQRHQLDCIEQVNGFLEKPFSISQLLNTITAVGAAP